MSQPPTLPTPPNKPPVSSDFHLISLIKSHGEGSTIQRKVEDEWVDTWTTRIVIDQDVEYRVAPILIKGWVNIYVGGTTSQIHETYLLSVRKKQHNRHYLRTIYVEEIVS